MAYINGELVMFSPNVFLSDGYEEGKQDGYKEGKFAILDESKYMHPTVSGKEILVDDVYEVEHNLDVQLVSRKKLGNYLDESKISDKSNTYGSITNNGGGTLTLTSPTTSLYITTNETLGTLCPNAPDDTYVTFYFEVEEEEYKGKIGLSYGPSTAYEGQEHTATWAWSSIKSVCPSFFISGVAYTRPVTIKNFKIGIISDEDRVTDFTGISVTRQGKNLIPCPYYSGNNTTIKGVTFKTNDNGEIELTGTSNGGSAGSIFYVWGYDTALANFTVMQDAILSGCPTNGTTSTYRLMALIQKSDGSNGYPQDYGSGVKIPAGSTIKYVYITISNGANVDNLVFKPQLEYGTSKTEYAPYVKPSTKDADADGVVRGLTSASPTMKLVASSDDVTIDCKYYRDIDTYINNLTMNVALTGGE